MILAALGIILLVKPLSALVIVAVLGYSARTALTVAIGLAQIGEFSFILSDLAKQHGLMSPAGHNVLVAAAIISITLNPLLFRSLPRTEAWLRRQPFLWKLLNAKAEHRAAVINQSATTKVEETGGRLAIVVGYGPVGRVVHRVLKDAGLSTVVIDMNMDTVSALNAAGQTAIFGDASHESILGQAGVRRTSHFVLTLPDASSRSAVVTAARSLNAKMRILVRARYLIELLYVLCAVACGSLRVCSDFHFPAAFRWKRFPIALAFPLPCPPSPCTLPSSSRSDDQRGQALHFPI